MAYEPTGSCELTYVTHFNSFPIFEVGPFPRFRSGGRRGSRAIVPYRWRKSSRYSLSLMVSSGSRVKGWGVQQ